jgi:3-hydroxy acid dehydrogenase/malonic semialdehyde reductase
MTYKTVLVTGATSGFGREIAIDLAKQGMQIIACGRRDEQLQTLAADFPSIIPYRIDVGKLGEIAKLHDFLTSKKLLPEVLINNAGLALDLAPADQADISDWETMIDVNITGLVALTRTFLPALLAHPRSYIINIGSIAGNWPYPGSNVYGATKAFVGHFSKNLRADLLGKNIRVTCLEPGMAETEFSLVRFKGEAEKAANVYEGTTPLVASDVSQIVSWLLSLPEHINVNSLEVMPTCQSWGPLAVARKAAK